MPCPEEWRVALEYWYRRYHQRAYVAPDPLETLYDYAQVEDREIVALIASALAYGQVRSIVANVRQILAVMTPHPARWLDGVNQRDLALRLRGLGHRWTRDTHLTALLVAVREARRYAGSLEQLHHAVAKPGTDPFVAWCAWLRINCRDESARHLIPDPEKGSPCKRLHLMRRWLVRSDEVDPGGWTTIRPAELTVPVDVHMHRIGRALGFTRRRQADRGAANEITDGFRSIAPDDPVRYDFCLSRLGIREGATRGALKNLRERILSGVIRAADDPASSGA